MNMSLKKKTVVVAIVALLLCVAVYLNIVYNRDSEEAGPDDTDLAAYAEAEASGKLGEATFVDQTNGTPAGVEVKTGNEYFAETKLNRKNARDAALELLQQTLMNDSISDEAKLGASEQITKLAENAMAEARIEGLITAKGYDECVAFIGENSLSIVVSTPKDGLVASDVNKIRDIAITELGISAETIRITEVR